MDDRIAAILGFPAELLAYQRWLDGQRAQGGARDYLFADDKPRFEPRRGDVVVALPDVVLRKQRHGTRLTAQGASIDVDVPLRDAERIYEAIDGTRCLLEVRFVAGVSQEMFGRFLRATFGRLVLAPAAVAALDAELSGVELVRFAAPPYCIERAYWENMIAVRRRFDDAVLDDDAHFVTHLRELHVVALMGERLDSFYKPASPAADREVLPGALHDQPVELRDTAYGTLFLSGLRVKAPLLGGAAYHRALCRDLGEPDALDGTAVLDDPLPWGRIVVARSERDDDPARWFVPPRPIQPAHFTALREALHEALRASGDEVLAPLARFHQSWVRLHPFGCCNQSLAMNLVNAVLAQSHGAGIPHLILDHLALRLGRASYAEAFRRAVAAHVVPAADAATRLAILIERKHRSNRVIARLAAGEAAGDDDGARWALLSPGAAG